MLCNCHPRLKRFQFTRNHFQLCREHECRVSASATQCVSCPAVLLPIRYLRSILFLFPTNVLRVKIAAKAFCSTTAEVELNRNRNGCIRLLVFHAGNPLILVTLMHGSADVKIQFNLTWLIYSSDSSLQALVTYFSLRRQNKFASPRICTFSYRSWTVTDFQNIFVENPTESSVELKLYDVLDPFWFSWMKFYTKENTFPFSSPAWRRK